MSTLQERLEEISTAFLAQVPEAMQAVMRRATADLRRSGILERLPSVGGPLPAFELVDTAGRTVRSADLLARGSLVVTCYRGVW
jgi:hypothetical protein